MDEDYNIGINKNISIIVPCYNCAQSVEKAWQSILNQSIGVDKLECIFVDDASTDGGKTWDALCKIEKTSPDSVMIIHLEENLRQGGARNTAIAYATGEYIMFLDADDELYSNSCEQLYEAAEKENIDIIQFNHRRVLGNDSKDNTSITDNEIFEIKTDSDRIPFLNASKVDYGCWNKFYRRRLIIESEARFAEHAVYEEPLFVYPCFLYAHRIMLLRDVLYQYNLHMGSTITSQIGHRILDHPRVQLELLEYCMRHSDVWSKYREVIGLYFLWSYYCETLCFAGMNVAAEIPLEYFKQMQQVCKTLFSDWQDMSLFRSLPGNVINVIRSIDRKFDSQTELNEFAYEVSALI